VIYAFIPPCGIECLAIVFNTAMITKLSIEQHVLRTVFISLYRQMRRLWWYAILWKRYRDISMVSTLQNLNY